MDNGRFFNKAHLSTKLSLRGSCTCIMHNKVIYGYCMQLLAQALHASLFQYNKFCLQKIQFLSQKFFWDGICPSPQLSQQICYKRFFRTKMVPFLDGKDSIPKSIYHSNALEQIVEGNVRMGFDGKLKCL